MTTTRPDTMALRAEMGLPMDEPVLLTPGPPTREGGHYYAVWATALLQQIRPGIRVIVPGNSVEQRRLDRFVRSFQMPEILVCTGDRRPLEELLGVANVFVIPALVAVPTDGVERAMAAGVPIVASNLRPLSDRIEDGVTGLLVPPRKPTHLAGAILRVIEESSLRSRLVEAARGKVANAHSLPSIVER